MTNILHRNNVKVIGSKGPTILFAHGLNCDQTSYKYITEAFKENFKLVLFDFVGAGKSDLTAYNKAKYSSLDGYAGDVIEICDDLGLTGIIFVGHSVSCMIGVLASIKRPELFSKLVFIAPSPRYINNGNYIGGFDQEEMDGLLEIMDEDYVDWSRKMAPSIVQNPDQVEVNKDFTDVLCATDPTIGKAFARVAFLSDNRKDLSLTPVESLTLQCSDDIIAPIEVGYYMKDHMPGNQLKILQATGHCPHLTAPAETIAAIRSYIE